MHDTRAEALAQVAQGISNEGFETEHPYWKQWHGWKKGEPYPTEDDAPSEAMYFGNEGRARRAKINRAANALEKNDTQNKDVTDLLK